MNHKDIHFVQIVNSIHKNIQLSKVIFFYINKTKNENPFAVITMIVYKLIPICI